MRGIGVGHNPSALSALSAVNPRKTLRLRVVLGNSHSLDNIPFVLVGGGLGFKMGQSLKLELTPHNRLWLAIAHAFGHSIKTFGNPKLCEAGPLSLA